MVEQSGTLREYMLAHPTHFFQEGGYVFTGKAGARRNAFYGPDVLNGSFRLIKDRKDYALMERPDIYGAPIRLYHYKGQRIWIKDIVDRFNEFQVERDHPWVYGPQDTGRTPAPIGRNEDAIPPGTPLYFRDSVAPSVASPEDTE